LAVYSNDAIVLHLHVELYLLLFLHHPQKNNKLKTQQKQQQNVKKLNRHINNFQGERNTE